MRRLLEEKDNFRKIWRTRQAFGCLVRRLFYEFLHFCFFHSLREEKILWVIYQKFSLRTKKCWPTILAF